MKIKLIKTTYTQVLKVKPPKRQKPLKPNIFFRTLARVLSCGELKKAKFSFTGKVDKKGGPYLILMNHSSFIDLKIAHKIFYPMPFQIVCTHDALVGKKWLMRRIGCMPTRKFVSDVSLISDIKYSIEKKKTSVLMYPEAGYSFDGTTTTLPDNFGRLIKILGCPVLYVQTFGAFHRDPLYNGLKIRNVKVSAEVKTLISKEEIKLLNSNEISERIENAFSFDNFRWQQQNKIEVVEPFRADGLQRILYKCPACGKERQMTGRETELTCNACKKTYVLDEIGYLKAKQGVTEFNHIPDWYAWQREQVKNEILSGDYTFDEEVTIGILKDYKGLYLVGKGRLKHDKDGFVLNGEDGLYYTQKPLSSYGLNADYYWYEIGDVICIGDSDTLYYCFTDKTVPVAKTRLAVEELYKFYKNKTFK